MHDYNLHSYASMLEDSHRVDAYLAAMRGAIVPGAVVVEIGTGTGFFAIMACRFGASRVYAIEPSSAIEVARQLARANGCADRIEFIKDLSTRVVLPERAHVIVSDLHGVLPWYEMQMETLADAVKRFLRPDGQVIPAAERLWVTVVEAPEPAGASRQHELHGVDLRPVAQLLAHQGVKAQIESDQVLAVPQLAGLVDYLAIGRRDLSVDLSLTATRGGKADGLGCWFDATLFKDVDISNAPGRPRMIYGQALFPFPETVAVEAGDRIDVALGARPAAGEYVWNWHTRIERHGKTVAAFRQSDFNGQVLSLSGLHKTAGTFTPELSADGCEELFILERMGSRKALEAIARELQAAFPQAYSTPSSALVRVAKVSARFAR
ncbi:MAG: Methyltransferase type 12 [Ramlibacter sp.]|nr:Methyltransferase type 12 [Ramlibacter sp.]